MAKKYRTETQTQEVQILDEVQCDVCKKWFSVKDNEFEVQEFLHIKELYGYGSKHFGDMTEMEIDICEACTYEMLGPFCRFEDRLWPYSTVVYAPIEDPEDLDFYQR